MKRSFIPFVLVTMCLAVSSATADIVADLQSAVDTFGAGNPQAPGIIVHVECPQLGLDHILACGHEDRGSSRPLTAAHTFRIASNTKTYVAATVLRLAEEGKLGLDNSLEQHLPARYRDLLKADGYDLEAMTLRQVLGHTAGLFEHPADPRFAEQILADPQHVWTRDEQVARTVEWGDPVGSPGEKYSYSDTGYILLGAIIEEKTGLNLGVAVRELCDYERLGLGSTWWEILEEAPPGAGPRAHQYYEDHDTTEWHPSMDLHGGGGLLTDVRDLGRFMRRLLSGQVLREEGSLAAMIEGGTSGYRLGLIHTELAGREALGHTGFWNTFVFHVPMLDLTIAGCVLSHHAARGQELADELVKVAVAQKE